MLAIAGNELNKRRQKIFKLPTASRGTSALTELASCRCSGRTPATAWTRRLSRETTTWSLTTMNRCRNERQNLSCWMSTIAMYATTIIGITLLLQIRYRNAFLMTLFHVQLLLATRCNNCRVSNMLFHRRTRASYVYNGCLAWYNVVLTHGSTQA